MNRDIIVFGIQLEKSREKLINVGKNLTLDKATQLAQYFQEQLKIMGQSSAHAQAISKSRPMLTTHPFPDRTGRRQATQSKMNPSTHKSYASKVKIPSIETKSKHCYKCGRQHPLEIPVQRNAKDAALATIGTTLPVIAGPGVEDTKAEIFSNLRYLRKIGFFLPNCASK